MASTKSYQRRKRDIKYLEQCCNELEEICVLLAKQVGPGMRIPLVGKGIEGDQFITPYNNGEFEMKLIMQANERKTA